MEHQFESEPNGNESSERSTDTSSGDAAVVLSSAYKYCPADLTII